MFLDEPLFLAALPVVERLLRAGYEAYFVGGSVRDILLGKPISDVDIATSATPLEVKALFSHTVDVGIEHGTVMVLYHGEGYEVTTFRTEEGYQDFRHPDRVTFVRSLEEDLKRRDFTINALALDASGVVHDFFDGKGDLTRGVIRCVGNPIERFNEDALRMFRAVRFVGQLGFTLEAQTAAAIRELRFNLEHVAVERMRVEFEKMMTSSHRREALHHFIETGLYEACPHFTTMTQALQKIADVPVERLTVTQAWLLLAVYHEMTMEELRSLLKAWKNSNDLIRAVTTGYEMYRLRQTQGWDFQMAYVCPQGVAQVVEALVDTPQLQQLNKVYQELPITSKQDIALNGHDIVTLLALEKKGPMIGEVLNDLEKGILSGHLENRRPELESYVLANYRKSREHC